MAALMMFGCATVPAKGGEAGGSRRGRSKRSTKRFAAAQGFPSQTRVAELGSASIEAPLATVGTLAAVSEWSLDPAETEADWRKPYAGNDPNAKAYGAWIQQYGKGVTNSGAMACVAHQYARFSAEHGSAVAGEDIKAFIQSRCGIPYLFIGSMRWEMEPAKFRDLSASEPADPVIDVIKKLPKGSLAGLGVAKTEDKVVIVAAHTKPPVQFEPIPFDAGSDGVVAVRGATNERTEWINASITQGDLGVQSCDRVPASGPKGGFVFRCKTKSADERALIEVSMAPKGSVLGETVARFYVSPSGAQSGDYAAPNLALPVTQGDFSPNAVLAGINTLRSQAGLSDLRGAQAQNSVAENLFPHLIGNEDTRVQNEAAMGLMAGWQVNDVLRGASFQMMFAHRDLPLAKVLAADLIFPSFRQVALAPDVSVFSSAALDGDGTRGLLHVAYEVFERRDFAYEERAVLDALDDARAKVGLPPVTRVMGGADEVAMAESAERIRTGESVPEDELDGMLEYFSSKVKRRFMGSMQFPMRLEGWNPDFPDDFFKHENIAVTTSISYFQPEGAAWGQHVVFLIYTPL